MKGEGVSELAGRDLARGSVKMAKQAKKENYMSADVRIRKGQPEEDRKRRKTAV